MSTSLTGRVALVTGASRGIGAAVALELARAGAHIVAVARTVGALEELDDQIKAAGSTATLVPLDLKDMEGLDRLGPALAERFGRLDVLVANAAILGPISPLHFVEPKQFDEIITVNVTANYRLSRALLPLLMAGDAGRAVFLTSGAAWKARAYWGPYALTKAALDAMARTLAAETATTPLKVNLFNPGPIRTRMRAAAMPGEDASTLDPPEVAAAAVLPLCLPDLAQTGRLYDLPSRAWQDYQPPA
jgi:NAD(P)-dependent dehydrogenase (short-subunit alcohol dehydrogenase family)